MKRTAAKRFGALSLVGIGLPFINEKFGSNEEVPYPLVWELKQLSSGTSALDVTSDGTGAVWLFVGTDSGFESTTNVYFTQFSASFEPL